MVVKMEISFWIHTYLERDNDYFILNERNDITIFAGFIFGVIVFGILYITLPQIPFLKGLSELNLVYYLFIILLLVSLLASIPSLFISNLVITEESIIINQFFFLIRYKKVILNKLDFALYLSVKKDVLQYLNRGYKKEQDSYYFILLKKREDETNNETKITIKKIVNRLPNKIEKDLLSMLEKHGIKFDVSANDFLHLDII